MEEKPSANQGPFLYENWQAANAGAPLNVTYEYPLFTDAHITGHVEDNLGPYKLLNAVSNGSFRLSRPAIVLRAEYYLSNIDASVETETYDERYHGGLLSDEVAALCALCMGIRLRAGAESRFFRVDDDPKGYPASSSFTSDPIVQTPIGRPILPRVIGTHSLDDSLLISSMTLLSPKNSMALVRAARLYENAVWVAESTPELSWLMFTSAVETAANRWKEAEEEPIERLRTSRPKLEILLKEKGDEEFVRQVAEQIAPYMGATKKFVDFLISYLPPPPSERPNEFVQLKWDKKSMKQSLSKIYGYRSRALHGGIPFPSPMSAAPLTVGDSDIPSEIPLGLATQARGGRWAAKDLPMLLHTFEYIVRHALLNWWKSIVSGCGQN